VTSMESMFYSPWGSSAFNQDLRAWSVKKVTNCQGMMDGTAKKAKRPKFRLMTIISSSAS